MRILSIVPLVLITAGCATQPPAVSQPPKPVVAMAPETGVIETRYEVRAYRDANSPDLKHEAHTVYRRTKVPTTYRSDPDQVPRSTTASTALSPLPQNEELNAEIQTQRQITAELKATQASIAELHEQMKLQYQKLTQQSQDVVRLHNDLQQRERTQPKPESAPGQEPQSQPQAPQTIKW